ncbi:hypothetical protein EDB84DRAFT_1469441 [Lactarius hengduanensis]|nr:hypothetical protein EDB84DRAFT_1469441 [Lactarius hengduanensis]
MSLLTFVLFYVLVFRIVVSPQITSPSASTTWNAGDKVTVTWPALARVLDAQRRESGHRAACTFHTRASRDHPLAQDILLSTGSVQITVPNVPVGANYIVVLHDHRRVQHDHDPKSIPHHHFHAPFPSPHPSAISHSNDISYPVFSPVFSPAIFPHLSASSHAHRNVPDLFPIKQHAHVELGHIYHDCAEQLSVFVLERNDQQCAPCSTYPWRSRDNPLCGGRCNEPRAGPIT